MTGARAVILFVLGLVVGAAVVVGASLTFEETPPAGAVTVSPTFCQRTVGPVAETWGMRVLPQDRVVGERDVLTACAASSPTGDVRLTLTVLALGGDEERSVEDRIAPALTYACTAIEPGATEDGCSSAVESADDVVGAARVFATADERAVVTIVFTAPPARAAATADDVEALSRSLRSGFQFRG